MDNLASDPQNVTINRGERIRWLNAESGVVPIPLTSTSGDPDDGNEGELWDSGSIAPGDFFTRHFDDVGVFECYCEFHYRMGEMRHATVTVVESADTQP